MYVVHTYTVVCGEMVVYVGGRAGGRVGGRNSQLASLIHFMCNVTRYVECYLYMHIFTYALYVCM